MVFVLRVRAVSGMKRLVFPSPSSTWRDVQLQVADVCGVPVEHALLSRTPLHAADYIDATDERTLTQLGLNNGDVLYLAGEDSNAPPRPSTTSTTSSSSSLSSSSPPRVFPATFPNLPAHKLTPDCKHGPRGACPYCLGIKPGEVVREGACQHGPGVVCIHCSAHVRKAGKEMATWLCNHPDTVFCPKCIPPSSASDAASTAQCSCDHSKGQSCLRCMTRAAAIKIDKTPFARWLEERSAGCRFKHGPNVTCPQCSVPPFPSFAGKAVCDKGHRPYPEAVCLSCAPPNAVLRVQQYRHCDSISVEGRLLQPFYSSWMRGNTAKEKAAVLFGRYVPEPAETHNPGAVRAQVHALYEPPQEGSKGGVRFLKDEREAAVHEVAKRLGLEAVGWVVAVERREVAEQYGGKVLMSGAEVEQAARFQLRYPGPSGYSRFVTLILEQAAAVEPVAFQVADMAVALEKEKAFQPAPDPFFLATRPPSKTHMVPTIIYKDRPLRGGEAFLPDELLVKVIVSAPKAQLSLLKHHTYSSQGGSELLVKQWLDEFKNEEYEDKLSDFNLLVNLVRVLGSEDVVLAVCDALREGRKLSPEVRSQLDTAMLSKNLL